MRSKISDTAHLAGRLVVSHAELTIDRFHRSLLRGLATITTPSDPFLIIIFFSFESEREREKKKQSDRTHKKKSNNCPLRTCVSEEHHYNSFLSSSNNYHIASLVLAIRTLFLRFRIHARRRLMLIRSGGIITMTLLRFFFHIVVITLCSASIVSACPSVCSCYGSNVDCSNRGLQSIPAGVPRYVFKL